MEVVDTAGVVLGVGYGPSSVAFCLQESGGLPVSCTTSLAFEVC